MGKHLKELGDYFLYSKNFTIELILNHFISLNIPSSYFVKTFFYIILPSITRSSWLLPSGFRRNECNVLDMILVIKSYYFPIQLPHFWLDNGKRIRSLWRTSSCFIYNDQQSSNGWTSQFFSFQVCVQSVSELKVSVSSKHQSAPVMDITETQVIMLCLFTELS